MFCARLLQIEAPASIRLDELSTHSLNLPRSGINTPALINFRHVTWHRWSSPAREGGERERGEAARASQRRAGAAEASSARRGRSFLSPPPSVPAAPLHLSPALSPAPSLSPLLNWHRSGLNHDNRKAFLRGALSGSPRPRSPPTQISRRQGEGGRRREDRSVLPTGARRE